MNEYRTLLCTFVAAAILFAPSHLNAAPPVTSGLVLHLDGSNVNGDGTNPADSALISTWFDVSGLDNDASGTSGAQPTYVANAINGRGGVDFGQDTNDFLQTAATSDFAFTQSTIVIVSTETTTGLAVSVSQAGTHNEEFSVFHRFSRGIFHHTSDFNSTRLGHEDTSSDPYIQMALFGTMPSELENVINGVASNVSGFTDGSPSDFTAVNRVAYIGTRGQGGSDSNSNATIAEVLIYDRELTPEEQNQLGYYLGQRYAVETAWVPEPGSLILFPIGGVLLRAIGRRCRTANVGELPIAIHGREYS